MIGPVNDQTFGKAESSVRWKRADRDSRKIRRISIMPETDWFVGNAKAMGSLYHEMSESLKRPGALLAARNI